MRFLIICFFAFLVVSTSGLLFAGEEKGPSIRRGAELIGTAQSDVKDATIDKRLKGELDLLVPALKQISTTATILIESYFPGKKAKVKEDVIKNAYILAEQVQLYLRNKHGIQNEIFVAVLDNDEKGGDLPKIRITTFSHDYFE